MSHLFIHSVNLPSITHNSDDGHSFTTQASTSKQTLAVPEGFKAPKRSRSQTIPKIDTTHSLPSSPVTCSFPQRPAFRRAATTSAPSAASSTGTAKSSRFDDLHYAQTHFSRSTLLVYQESESTVAGCVAAADQDEDIRELLAASSDEESSLAPSTPGVESAKIPPRLSSVPLSRAKQSMESEKTSITLIEPITLLSPPTPKGQNSPSRRNGTELARQASRTSLSGRREGSIRSIGSSAKGSSKRRSRILMKIIPFARDSPDPPAAEPEKRFSTFPRIKSRELEEDEPIETLSARFSQLIPPASPALSASSMSGASSLTSPVLGFNDLPLAGRKSSSSLGRREGGRLKGASSRDSVRSIFSSCSSQGRAQSQDELEWEKMLEDAASRASWESSINYRPRTHSAARRAVPKQSTWPRAMQKPVQQSGLMLEHVFVDASDDLHTGQYDAEDAAAWGVPMSARLSSANNILPPRPPYTAPAGSLADSQRQKFGTLPRIKTRRPSTTGMSFQGEPSAFELKSSTAASASANESMLGTASLGRAAALRKRQVPAAASIWQMGRRRSSGVLVNGGSFSAGGATRMMPTIPQGHSREPSYADEIDDAPVWAGIDPYTQQLPLDGDYFSRRQDSLASEGEGELIPLRFGWRRESRDDLALLRRRSSSNHSAASSQSPGEVSAGATPVFNLHSFQKRPPIPRSVSSSNTTSSSSHANPPPEILVSRESAEGRRRFSRSTEVPDVPEAVTSASEAEDLDPLDLDTGGWCRRRSTFTNVLEPAIPLRAAA